MAGMSELTVRAINITVLSFCSLELLILLFSFPRFKLKDRASRIFYAKMLVSTFTIVCYTISIIIGDDYSNPISVIVHAVAYIGIYAVYMLYILYIIENVNNSAGHTVVIDLVTYITIGIGVVGSLLWMFSMFNNSVSELSSHHL